MPLLKDHNSEYIHFITIPHSLNKGWCWGEGDLFDWCKDNCKGNYTGMMSIRDTSQTRWTFQYHSDLVMFTLRWAHNS